MAKIWEDWATFEKANNAMATHAVAIAKHAAAKDADGVKASFGMMGKEGCGGCHKQFRGPKASNRSDLRINRPNKHVSF